MALWIIAIQFHKKVWNQRCWAPLEEAYEIHEFVPLVPCFLSRFYGLNVWLTFREVELFS